MLEKAQKKWFSWLWRHAHAAVYSMHTPDSDSEIEDSVEIGEGMMNEAYRMAEELVRRGELRRFKDPDGYVYPERVYEARNNTKLVFGGIGNRRIDMLRIDSFYGNTPKKIADLLEKLGLPKDERLNSLAAQFQR